MNNPDFTHLMFIDADIKYKTDDILALLALSDPNTEDYEVICGSYPKKSINWKLVERAVKAGIPADKLEEYADNPVMNLAPSETGKQTLDLSRPIEVLDTGTGFMLIRRSVFEKMAKAYPELLYTPDYDLKNENFDKNRDDGVYAFFDTRIEKDETSIKKREKGIQRYLSEDYSFCHLWRKIGGKVWVAPWIRLQHSGTYHFKGNIAAYMTIKSLDYHDLDTPVDNNMILKR
ncbi:MAG: hypothetical protein GYA69_05120 [Candidatus Moranbacteria bacterium]|nr:hypothetical protein [Candidatus Moranbacteria bacterium]